MPQILEETGQAQCIHAAADDGGGGLHAVPFLVVDGAGVAVALDDVGNGAVVFLAFHLAVAHSAYVDATCPLQTAHFGQHIGGVAALAAGAGYSAVACAVVVQVLVGEVAPRSGNHAWAAYVAINQKCHFVGICAKGFENKFAACQHFVVVVGGDVGRKELGFACFIHGTLHGIGYQRDGFFHGGKNLVALWFVVFDEVATQPKFISRLGKRLGAQAQLGLDDGAADVAAVFHGATQNAPEVRNVFGGAVKQLNGAARHVEINHLGVLNIAHALVVANSQRQEAGQHHAAINHVAVKQV